MSGPVASPDLGRHERHLSVVQAAALLGVDARTVRGDIRAGRLPAKRVGQRGIYRIDPADLQRLAELPDPKAPIRSPRRAIARTPTGEFALLARAMPRPQSADDSTGRGT